MENGLLVDRKRISESKHLHTRETYNINRQKIKWAKIYTHILENRECVISAIIKTGGKDKCSHSKKQRM